MVRWELLDTATVPDGGGELRLMRRGAEFSIMAGSIELMNSRLSGSEEALAALSCARIKGRPAPRVLIGGLGMGFTLRATLAVLPAGASVTVCELVPAVVDWARGPLAPLMAGCLADPRVRIEVGDVAGPIAGDLKRWDVILLDVDNGPAGLTRPANDRLYDVAGLAATRAALTPGGVLAVWSSAPDAGFTRALKTAGFQVEAVQVRARAGGRGSRHTIWIAVRP